VWAFSVDESVKGSETLAGQFDITMLPTADADVTLDFDVSAADMKAGLEGLSSVGLVHITREEFGAGWDAAAVLAATPGGYRFTVTFVRNAGTFDGGVTWPPASRDVDAFTTHDAALTGSSARVEVLELQAGSTPLQGRITLSDAAGSSSNMSYDAAPVDAKSALLQLESVGAVTVERFSLLDQAVGATAVIVDDADIGLYGNIVMHVSEDLRGLVAPGDELQLRRQVPHSSTLRTGDSRLSAQADVDTSSPVLAFATNVRGSLVVGDRVAVNGARLDSSGVPLVVVDDSTAKAMLTIAGLIPDGEFSISFDGGSASGCIDVTGTDEELAAAIGDVITVDHELFVLRRLPGWIELHIWYTGDYDTTPGSIVIEENTNTGSTCADTTAGTVVTLEFESNGGSAANLITLSGAPSTTVPLVGARVDIIHPVLTVGDQMTMTSNLVPLEDSDAVIPTNGGAGMQNMVFEYDVFEANGLFWEVTYRDGSDAALGNAAEISAVPSGPGDVEVTEVTAGYFPRRFEVPNLVAGVQYWARISWSTVVGSSSYSPISLPMYPHGVASEPLDVALDPVYAVTEVQTVTLGAQHVDEVQTITTTAAVVHEVQVVRISADATGTFTLKLGAEATAALDLDVSAGDLADAVQNLIDLPAGVTVLAARTVYSAGSATALSLTFEDASDDMPLLVCAASATACSVEVETERNRLSGAWRVSIAGQQTRTLPHDASAADVKTALDEDVFDQTDSVTVTRSTV
jgi:hypothetical protein